MSRGRQRRAGRAKKQRAGVHRSGIGQPAASSIEVAAAEAYERFARYVESTSSQEGAAAAVRADLRTAVEEVARLTCDLDLIKVSAEYQRLCALLRHSARKLG